MHFPEGAPQSSSTLSQPSADRPSELSEWTHHHVRDFLCGLGTAQFTRAAEVLFEDGCDGRTLQAQQSLAEYLTTYDGLTLRRAAAERIERDLLPYGRSSIARGSDDSRGGGGGGRGTAAVAARSKPPEWLPSEVGDKLGEIRLAVIVANEAYATTTVLRNAHRDATAMTKLLHALHFSVLFLHNATKVR